MAVSSNSTFYRYSVPHLSHARAYAPCRRLSTAGLTLLTILIIAFGSSTVSGQDQAGLSVSVTCLADPMQRNVLASLSLVQQQNNPDLPDVVVRRLFAQADQEIRSALEPFGYYSPAISKNLRRDGTLWQATFAIQPGDPVRITGLSLELTGEGVADPAIRDAVDRFPLRMGDVLDHQLYEQGKKTLTSKALDGGYRDVTFSRRTVEVNPNQNSASIFLVLDTGPLYRFGPTTFAADFISHDFLQRLLPYDRGDPFSPKLLVQLRQSLLASDYFSDAEVTTEAPSPQSHTVPVLVKLKQRLPNRYSFGIGYGTDTGTRGSVEWASRLFNRYGHQLSVQLQPSERNNSFGGVYTIPVRDPRTDRIALLGKWETEDFENTESERRTLSLSFDHIRKNWEYSLYLAFLDEDYAIGFTQDHATLLTPGLKTTWTLADDRLTTTRGIRLTLHVTGAEQNHFSETSFLQGSVSTKAIFSFLEDWRVLGRAQLAGTMVDDIYSLPPQLRFYAGGDQSVRGYAYKSIGPQDSLGNVLGGRYLTTASVELERTLVEEWSAALFFDSGDVFNAPDGITMRYSCGIGLRWNLTFGQVRLDLAKGLTAEGGSWRIHFNVGADL